MTRRFIRKTHPTIKELVEEEQCGCGNRMLPYLMKEATVPCTDPHLTGSIMVNGGCELGTAGDFLPGQFAALTDAEKSLGITQSNNFSSVYDSYKWSTVSVRSGVQSIELQDYATIGGGPHYLFPITGEACNDANYWSQPFNYGARVNPGDILDFAFWARTLDTTSAAGISQMAFEYHNEQGGFIGSFDGNNNVDFTGTFTQYALSAVVPANTYYVSAWVRVGNTFADGLSYFDDFTFSVT